MFTPTPSLNDTAVVVSHSRAGVPRLSWVMEYVRGDPEFAHTRTA